MGFTRILNQEREARERSWNRYVELLQLENWDVAAESEMRALAELLGKKWEDMLGDRRVITQAMDLQRRIEVGDDPGLSDRRVAAHSALEEYDKETAELIKQRRVGYRKLWLAESDLNEVYSRGQQAKHDLAKLMRQHPGLLGDPAAVS